ncbi:unnamed protein product [Hymenolepis diminuta]|uniref:Tyrosine-protein phosphatase domain-containing protein n=1 Tax=Hymenolepis diminuta TaxID=6216 RepID=A0A0R3SYB8_HYMDI|nr:unnamed protein product [Hymenolepis diminuta]
MKKAEYAETPAPIPIAEFASHSEGLTTSNEFPKLFDIFDNSTATQKFQVESHLTQVVGEKYKDRNRYGNVLPYYQSLVVLGHPWAEIRADPKPYYSEEDLAMHYVNACYVRRPIYNADGRALPALYSTDPEYIATQAPLINTIDDFLLMVHQQRSPLIIMLCEPKEKELGKYIQYWPNDEKQTFTSPRWTVQVLKISEHTENSVCVRQLRIILSETQEPWDVTHYQFLAWEDKRQPEIEPFYSFLKMHMDFSEAHPVGEKFGPTIIHCRYGYYLLLFSMTVQKILESFIIGLYNEQ